jgi:hypothetical protein
MAICNSISHHSSSLCVAKGMDRSSILCAGDLDAEVQFLGRAVYELPCQVSGSVSMAYACRDESTGLTWVR